MRYFRLGFILLILFATDARSTEIVEVQLPQLIGWYGFDGSTCMCNRTVSFHLDRMPTVVSHVWLHLSGTVNVGQYTCDPDPGYGPPPTIYPYQMEFVAAMKDTVGGHWWMADDRSPAESGQFELTILFEELYGWPVTWDFLRGGHANIEFSGGPGMLLVDCPVLVWPDATITSASVRVEGEFPVAVEGSTWGGIKALYR